MYIFLTQILSYAVVSSLIQSETPLYVMWPNSIRNTQQQTPKTILK